jgi:hypothetical protein
MRPAFALVLVGFASRAAGSLRFRRGDALPVMRRTEHRGDRSAWAEVPHDSGPRFERPGVIAWQALPVDFGSDDSLAPPEYKTAFSFLNEQFQTPWITIADSAGTYLTHLVFTIEHAGDQVTDVNWETLYDRPASSRPAHVRLEYQFVDASEEDPRTALTVLFVCCLGLASAAILCAVGDSDSSVVAGVLRAARGEAGHRRREGRGYDA